MITLERLKEVLHYDPDTGVWTWRIWMGARAPKGARAGCVTSEGYRHIRVDRRLYLAHRLAVLYMTGEWPTETVDHKNVTPGDDRWENLRNATGSQNIANSHTRCDSSSGLKGVSWHRQAKRWKAQIQTSGKKRHLGLFATREAAHEAYCVAAAKHFGEFARAA